jgi:integrase
MVKRAALIFPLHEHGNLSLLVSGKIIFANSLLESLLFHVIDPWQAYQRKLDNAPHGEREWMRDAMTETGLPLDCRQHGLRKTFGRLLADAGATAHEIMAALGHLTLAEAERYTREADRRRGGRRAIEKLEDHKANSQKPTSGQRPQYVG